MPDDLYNDQAVSQGVNQDVDEDKGTDTGSDQEIDTEQKSETTYAGIEDAGKGEDEGDDGTQKDTSKNEKGQKENAKVPTDKGLQKKGDDDKAEPEVRKRLSPQDFIIQRQQKKIAKLKAGEIDEIDESENEEVAPEDEALIKKVVAPILQPVLEKTLLAEDEQEIQDFLKDNPDFKPYEAKARRFMQHPSRRQLPIKSIFYEIAGDDLLKIGANRKAKADEKAKQTQTGGGSNRIGEGGGKSNWELSKEDFEDKQERIRHSQNY